MSVPLSHRVTAAIRNLAHGHDLAASETFLLTTPLLDGTLLWRARDEVGMTALMEAVCCNTPSARPVRTLLARGSQPEQLLARFSSASATVDLCNGAIALHWACILGNVVCVHVLLSHSPREQVIAAGVPGMTPLMAACETDSAACAQAVLQHSPEHQVRAMDAKGLTALMRAVRIGNVQCVEVLLHHFPEVQVMTFMGDAQKRLTPLMIACEFGSANCVQLLLQHCPDAQVKAREANRANALSLACFMGHSGCVRLLLQHSPREQIEATTILGRNALFAACIGNHTACVELLLQHWPEEQVTRRAQEGQNALMVASMGGHTECVRLLLQHCPEAQIKASTVQGDHTALSFATERGHRECVSLLQAVSPSAQSPQPSASEVTTADSAARSPSLSPGRQHQHKDRPAARVPGLRKGFFATVNKGQPAAGITSTAAEATAAECAPAKAEGQHALSVLQAIMSGDEGYLAQTDLLDGSRLWEECEKGLTALMVAVGFNQAGCVRALLSRGSPAEQVLATTPDGVVALHFGCALNHCECVQALLEHCPDQQVKLTDKEGAIGLMEACKRGHTECVRLLLRHSPEEQIKARTAQGETALTFASRGKHRECVSLIIQAARQATHDPTTSSEQSGGVPAARPGPARQEQQQKQQRPTRLPSLQKGASARAPQGHTDEGASPTCSSWELGLDAALDLEAALASGDEERVLQLSMQMARTMVRLGRRRKGVPKDLLEPLLLWLSDHYSTHPSKAVKRVLSGLLAPSPGEEGSRAAGLDWRLAARVWLQLGT